MARKAKVGEQRKLGLQERNWGGARRGAGRKPKGPRPLGDLPATPHHVRPELERRHPLHVTLRMMPEVWSLRSERSFRVLSRNGKPTRHREWQDTVLMAPREKVEIGLVADNPGDWMIHCHILEHQAAGMMGVFRVV